MKTNKEYSAVLAEIEGAKVEKDRLEEEILGLMELQERLGREVVEGDARLRPQEAEARVQEAAAAEELRALEVDVEGPGASGRASPAMSRATSWSSTAGSSGCGRASRWRWSAATGSAPAAA